MAQNLQAASELIDRKDCVLIIIDVQEKLIPQIAYKELMVKNIVKLIKFAKIINLPIIMTEQINLGPTVSEIISELPNIQPIEKASFSCFGQPDFVNKLNETGKNILILTGMETQICVTQTALRALQNSPKYNVHVISDAVSSRKVDNWRIGLDRLRDAGVVVSSFEMFVFELLGQAGTDEFRQMLPMVK